MAEEKTNVMRGAGPRKRCPTPPLVRPPGGGRLDGVSVAALIGKEPGAVCKTLVTQGSSKKYYVFVIPAERELDLKAAAKAAGEKSIEMIRQAQLLPLTGYVPRGLLPRGDEEAVPHLF